MGAKLSVEQLFQAFAEHSLEVFLVAEAGGAVLYVNAAVKRMFGRSVAEVIGRPCRILLAEGQSDSCALESGRLLGWNAAALQTFPIVVNVSIAEIDGAAYAIARIKDDRERSALQDALIAERSALRTVQDEREALSAQIAALTAANKELAASLEKTKNIKQLRQQLEPLLPMIIKFGLATLLASSALLSDKFDQLGSKLKETGAGLINPSVIRPAPHPKSLMEADNEHPPSS